MNMEYQDVILLTLKDANQLNSQELQKELGLTYEALYAELVSLVADKYIVLESKKTARFYLTKEGSLYADEGTPEAKIFALSTVEGVPK